MNQTGLLINLDGTTREIELGTDSLKVMYRELACHFVDVVRLSSQLDMWVDDEGLYRQPVNPLATALARSYGLVWQDYHGPALLCSSNDQGDTVGLTPEQTAALHSRLTDVRAKTT